MTGSTVSSCVIGQTSSSEISVKAATAAWSGVFRRFLFFSAFSPSSPASDMRGPKEKKKRGGGKLECARGRKKKGGGGGRWKRRGGKRETRGRGEEETQGRRQKKRSWKPRLRRPAMTPPHFFSPHPLRHPGGAPSRGRDVAPPPALFFERTFLQPAVLGGVDGITTTLAVVAGGVGASLATSSIAVLGTASLFADAVSMGVSETLSASGSATLEWREVKLGATCALAFLCSGAVPLLVFLAASASSSGSHSALVSAAAVSAASAFVLLFFLGYVQGRALSRSPFPSAVRVLVLGGVASAIALAVGFALQGVG